MTQDPLCHQPFSDFFSPHKALDDSGATLPPALLLSSKPPEKPALDDPKPPLCLASDPINDSGTRTHWWLAAPLLRTLLEKLLN